MQDLRVSRQSSKALLCLDIEALFRPVSADVRRKRTVAQGTGPRFRCWKLWQHVPEAGTNAAAKMIRECTSRSATILARYSFSFQFLQSSILVNNNTTSTLTTTTSPEKNILAKYWTIYQTTARLEIDQNIQDKQNPTPVLASSLVFHRGLRSALGFRALNPNPNP
jgi:hypothetical protein